MKRSFGALLLALVMTASLTACGGGSAETPASAAPTPEAAAPTPAATPTPAPTATPTPAPTPTPEAATPTPEPTVEAAASAAPSEPAKEVIAEATPTPAAEPTPEPTPEAPPKTYHDGTYSGVGQGYHGDIEVSVTIADDKIADVTVVSHGETAGISDAALEEVPAAIVANNTPDVDGMTSATASHTTDGIIEAVKDALSKAKV